MEMDTFSWRQLCQAKLLHLSSEKGSKGKQLAPVGSEFFPYRVDPFSEVALHAREQTQSYKSCLSCKKIKAEKLSNLSRPLNMSYIFCRERLLICKNHIHAYVYQIIAL